MEPSKLQLLSKELFLILWIYCRKATKRTPAKPKTVATKENLDSRNHDLCDACNGPGQFLCCEACPNVFHFACVDPPMEVSEVEELEGPWFCKKCAWQKQHSKTKSSTRGRRKNRNQMTFFEVMAQDLETQNPVAFSLPENIRNYFDGVSTGPNGAYIDATTVKSVKYRNGRPEEQDYHRLKDKNNNYIYCYWCQKTGLRKPIIPCDFCSLYWHLDCLNPPLTIPPNIAKKWKCPCHPQQQIRYRIPRQEQTITTMDSSSTSTDSYSHILDSPIVQHNPTTCENTQQNENESEVITTNPPTKTWNVEDTIDTKQMDNKGKQQNDQTRREALDVIIHNKKLHLLPQTSFKLDFMSTAERLLKNRERRALKNARIQKKNENSNSNSGTSGSSSGGSNHSHSSINLVV
ncbi:uncharacterized protein BX664DRAFT_329620 [Halteromyces radiatus]|uniref:uncharacterized protein n=1 Tax=Halteromyces radiatus TaxID=101107 RepID=UPI00221F9813|nr:uncharacterized protein BX664DRAFT_329620 [Halteromyces radiatus]KAI8093398.1 hypothetical protein BX664DRAFT_329620 [Halteromyces radiatus]